MTTPEPQNQFARKVIRLIVIGVPSEEIANTLNVPESQVKILIQSPMFQAMVKLEKQRIREALVENIPQALEALAPKAVEVYQRALEDADMQHALRGADAVMDRGRYPKRSQVDQQHTVVINISEEQAAVIEATARELGRPLPPRNIKRIEEVLEDPDVPEGKERA